MRGGNTRAFQFRRRESLVFSGLQGFWQPKSFTPQTQKPNFYFLFHLFLNHREIVLVEGQLWGGEGIPGLFNSGKEYALCYEACKASGNQRAYASNIRIQTVISYFILI
jgi:hypothetical protein